MGDDYLTGRRSGWKPPQESDSTDTDDNTYANNTETAHCRLSRQELKALDREIPWTQVIKGPRVADYLRAVEKEALSWEKWGSVQPLTDEEASQVLKDKILSKRVLRARACCRDQARGQGPVRAKCTVVCLGHKDPDLFALNRQAPTPTRTSEHALLMVLVAGSNREYGTFVLQWKGWTGDARTAFLQTQQQSRPLPLFLSRSTRPSTGRPPSTGFAPTSTAWQMLPESGPSKSSPG